MGSGAGASIINALAIDDRIFDLIGTGILNLSRVTLTLGDASNTTGQRNGGAIRVQNGGHLDLAYSAIVGNDTGHRGSGGGIYFDATATGAIKASVITVNSADEEPGGVSLADSAPGAGGAVTVETTIIVNNTDADGGVNRDVFAGANRTFTSLGNNRFGNETTGLVHNPTGNGDYMGTANYVVTSVADTYDGTTDPANMSLRDAIHQANITAGTQEIWLPAWDFVLTRDRSTFGGDSATDTSVAFGDLDITDSLTIRGIDGETSVAWLSGAAVDKTFELLGDYHSDGNVNAADDALWRAQNGQSINLEADGDDDGDVDDDDYDVYFNNFNNTLTLDDILFA